MARKRKYLEAKINFPALLAADQPVIFSVGANPEPDDIAVFLDCKSAIGQSDSHRPETSNLLEVKRGMRRVLFQQREVLVRKSADLNRKSFVSRPEAAAREMPHRPRVWPRLNSSRVSSAK